MVLETERGTLGSPATSEQSFHWAKLTSKSCEDLAVKVPAGFKRLKGGPESVLVPNVWPKLMCSDLASL